MLEGSCNSIPDAQVSSVKTAALNAVRTPYEKMTAKVGDE